MKQTDASDHPLAANTAVRQRPDSVLPTACLDEWPELAIAQTSIANSLRRIIGLIELDRRLCVPAGFECLSEQVTRAAVPITRRFHLKRTSIEEIAGHFQPLLVGGDRPQPVGRASASRFQHLFLSRHVGTGLNHVGRGPCRTQQRLRFAAADMFSLKH